jgi:hypothetical protein
MDVYAVSEDAAISTEENDTPLAVSEETEEKVEVAQPVEAAYASGIAREEERKGKEYLAKLEAEETERQAALAEYFSESDVVMLAQLIDIEAGAVWPLNRRAAVGWTVLNRLDNGRWGPTTISGIITQPGQYAWYSGRGYSQMNYDIAMDVLERWADEKINGGVTDPGRVLPQNYENFYGDGSQNHFYDKDGSYWDYSVGYDPYEDW